MPTIAAVESPEEHVFDNVNETDKAVAVCDTAAPVAVVQGSEITAKLATVPDDVSNDATGNVCAVPIGVAAPVIFKVSAALGPRTREVA